MVRCSTLTTFTLFIYSSYAPKYGKLLFLNLFYFQKTSWQKQGEEENQVISTLTRILESNS
jgi:hypothetical protein